MTVVARCLGANFAHVGQSGRESGESLLDLAEGRKAIAYQRGDQTMGVAALLMLPRAWQVGQLIDGAKPPTQQRFQARALQRQAQSGSSGTPPDRRIP